MDDSATSEAKRGLSWPIIVALVAAALMVVAYFLPYASATQDYRDALMTMPDYVQSDELGMTNADIADMSLFEYARVYAAAGDLGARTAFTAVYLPLLVGAVALPVLALLFAVLRKPVPVIVFSVLAVALLQLLNWDFEDRLVVPNSSYDVGIARWVYLAAGIAAIAGAVWAIVLRRQARRA